MSVAVKERRARPAVGRRAARCVWALFPHAVLILSLIGYAVLGAVVFQELEGRPRNGTNEYRNFVRQVVATVRNHTDESEEVLMGAVEQKIRGGYQSVWSQSHENWTFYGSLFFCCTVFTTVGYGEIYPVTGPGRAACIIYAMLGIPLMLLVISDVGDILAMLVSNGYQRLHSSCKHLLTRVRNLCRTQERVAIHNSIYTPSQEIVVSKPMDIREVMLKQSGVKQKSSQFLKNVAIFERIIEREKFGQNGPLVRTCSCPELNRMPPVPLGFKMWDFSTIGQEMESLNVPFLLILFVVFAYILSWALILPLWETDLYWFDAFYFCFITLTTIGFGDIVPKHPKFFMLTFLFIITGMAIMSMAFKLGQSRIISFYHRCIGCVSCLGVGKKGKYKVQKMEIGHVENVENP
ncbi:potassium channel subfamily K member 18 [Tachysurus fulvidraco]|uniref:potassium channel subfamily K member 18 n=1 Tax=Tachysurus fulvidraco TaxID=1234273 RepID=UPI000F4E97E3|nr:potassium channel subfamily K member 18 [Tachysurus fulvidraco]